MAVKSLIEELPEIVKRGKREYERIIQRLQSDNKMLLQTNEYVLPSKDKSGLFRGKIRQCCPPDNTVTSADCDLDSWFNRLVYGDNIFVMQALLNGDEKTGLPSMRGAIDLIYIDPPFDSKADYRTKITLPTGDIEARPAVIDQFAYSDTWKNDTVSYLEMLYPRLMLMRDLCLSLFMNFRIMCIINCRINRRLTPSWLTLQNKTMSQGHRQQRRTLKNIKISHLKNRLMH